MKIGLTIILMFSIFTLRAQIDTVITKLGDTISCHIVEESGKSVKFKSEVNDYIIYKKKTSQIRKIIHADNSFCASLGRTPARKNNLLNQKRVSLDFGYQLGFIASKDYSSVEPLLAVQGGIYQKGDVSLKNGIIFEAKVFNFDLAKESVYVLPVTATWIFIANRNSNKKIYLGFGGGPVFSKRYQLGTYHAVIGYSFTPENWKQKIVVESKIGNLYDRYGFHRGFISLSTGFIF